MDTIKNVVDGIERKDYDRNWLLGETGVNPVRARRRKAQKECY